MDPDLHDRRERTFELLIVEGRPYNEVVRKIAHEFNANESTVKSDISRMSERDSGNPGWISDLVNETSRKDGLVRLKEVRKNRQELARMAREAKQDGDLELAMEIRSRIDDNLDLDIALSQSLGHTEREPAQVEATVEKQVNVTSEVVEVTPDDVEEDGDE